MAATYQTYTGRWRTDRVRPADQAAPLGKAQPELHNHYDLIAPGSRPPWVRNERRDPAPPRMMATGEEWDLVAPWQAPGRLLDKEDYGNHDIGTVSGGIIGSKAKYARYSANLARQDDRGAAAEELWSSPRLRNNDATYLTKRLEVAPSDDGSRTGALRGRNSLTVNNPDGFRNGFRTQRFVDRRIWQRRRTHDIRGIRDHLAAAPLVSPPLPGNGNRYTSPYSTGIFSRTRSMNSPMSRRVPERWDQPMSVDNTEAGDEIDYAAAGYQSWGL